MKKVTFLTIKEICEIMNREGFQIDWRTFRFYIEKKVFPKPEFIMRKEKGMQGVYSDDVLESVRQILKWRNEGIKLSEVKKRLFLVVTVKVQQIYESYKFSEDKVMQYVLHGDPGKDPLNKARAKLIDLIRIDAEETLWKSDMFREAYVLENMIFRVETWVINHRREIEERGKVVETVKNVLANLLSGKDLPRAIDIMQSALQTSESVYREAKAYLKWLQKSHSDLLHRMD